MGITTKIQVGDETREVGAFLITDGTSITAGSDLNDFKTLGTFLCKTDAIAQSLLNCPVKYVFTMNVSNVAGRSTMFLQELISASGTRYTRYFNPSTSVWTEWKHDIISTGDTMTGNLNINKSEPRIYENNPLIDITTDPSSQQVSAIVGRDKNNTNIGSCEFFHNTDGTTETAIKAYHIDGSTTRTNYISAKVAKNGTRSYSVSDPAAFREAISAASSSHNHSASNITSGTLPLARGGTGASLSSSPSLLVNLESTSAANVMTASPRPGVTGTLPVSHGGTGVTTSAGIGLKAYPVGALYISYNSTSPAELFGGTWTQIKDGRFLRGSSSSGETGGSNSRTLVKNNLPKHSHDSYDTESTIALPPCVISNSDIGGSDKRGFGRVVGGSIVSFYSETATQSQQAMLGRQLDSLRNATPSTSFDNQPLFIDVYMWRRTA